MRTLRSLPLDDKERLKIAEEALNVYAPLAHRMGVMKVKGELEDLAFKILHPQMFQVKNTHTHLHLESVYLKQDYSDPSELIFPYILSYSTLISLLFIYLSFYSLF